MIREIWSAELRQDRFLIGLWWGMHSLAALALGLCGIAVNWPIGIAVAVSCSAAALLFRLALHRPAAWFDTGHLTLDGERARWQDSTGALVEGQARWLWTGESIVGLILIGTERKHASLWLTERRVGPIAWWQLQRWLRINRAADFSR